jgi:hypothetical protein
MEECVDYQDLMHGLILEHLRKKLSRDYREIHINGKGEQKVDYKGSYPDMILGNHGMVLAVLKLETGETISEKQAGEWKSLSGLGVKLILMIPKNMKMKVTDLLWSQGLMDKVSIGTYEIAIQMP